MGGKPYKALPWGQRGIWFGGWRTTDLKSKPVLVGVVGGKLLIMDLEELEVRLGAISATAARTYR